MSITTIAHYRIGLEQRERLRSALESVAQATRAEPGNLYFHIVQDVEDPGHVVLVEGWRSEGDLRRHRDSMHFVEGLLGSVVPLLTSRTVTVARPLYDDFG